MNDGEILEKTIVSLDEHAPETAEKIIQKWKYKVHSFKVNHILYSHIGKNHRNIFCDYKLYDIPNTMCKVIENLIDTGADMVTINMNNNIKSMEAISQYAEDIKLLGVTVLTSWDHNDSYFIHKQQIGDMYERSLWMMEKYGFWGMICSAKDIKMFKKTKLKKITPGIRFSHDMLGDQVRVTTPEKAIRNGSDYLVMGRSFFTNFENVKEKNDKA